METKLRVKEVQGPQENYQHTPTEPNIEPNPQHGGLRVIDHGKHELVHDHPARKRHPQSEQLAGLGNPRD